MDVKVTFTEICACKRGIVGCSGSCDLCIQEGTQAFWDLVNGKITYPGFMRRLRRGGIARRKDALG